MKITSLAKDEHSIQCAVVTWAAMNSAKWPGLKLLYAIPNGAHYGKETKTFSNGKTVPVAAIRARRMKAEGMRAGVPDLCLPVARGGFHGLYIEMKTEKGSVRDEQVEWLTALREQGYQAVIARSEREAVEVLRSYICLNQALAS